MLLSEGKNNVRNNSVLLGTALDGNKRVETYSPKSLIKASEELATS